MCSGQQQSSLGRHEFQIHLERCEVMCGHLCNLLLLYCPLPSYPLDHRSHMRSEILYHRALYSICIPLACRRSPFDHGLLQLHTLRPGPRSIFKSNGSDEMSRFVQWWSRLPRTIREARIVVLHNIPQSCCSSRILSTQLRHKTSFVPLLCIFIQSLLDELAHLLDLL